MNRLESLNNQVNSINPSENILLARWGERTMCVTLNNPRRKNAINTAMSAKLQAVAFNPQNSLIILRSNEHKVFGCGGDVKDLCSYIMNETSKTKLFEYFFTEFSTNYAFYLLNTHPVCASIAIYDGYTIGEAFILSFYSKIKIATQNTIISMPGKESSASKLKIPLNQHSTSIGDPRKRFMLNTDGKYMKTS